MRGNWTAGRVRFAGNSSPSVKASSRWRNGASIPRACFSRRRCVTSTVARGNSTKAITTARELDEGDYDRAEYVFGACAAAALYRREMIDDVSIGGDFFDPDFFAYREDADVAWRAQLLGWRCIYAPSAVGWHVRTVVPGDRRSITPSINMHSVKNRFLMRIKNVTPGLYRHCWLPMTVRDMAAVAGGLLLEPRSLPAFWRVAKCWPAARERRLEIMRALREESFPDAHQECHARPLPALLAAHDGARYGRCGGVPVARTAVAAGILAGGEMLAGRPRAAARDHAAAPRERPGADAGVPL